MLRASRPTAVNLAWALDEMRDDPSAEHARAIHRGRGRALPRDGRARGGAASRRARARSRTATPAGSRPAATGARSARCSPPGSAGLLAHVWVDETRPLLQGARLTAWELETAGIPHTVIADSAAASLMAAGEVDCVFTGADRIAANGDTANKIGTYGLAVLARHHDVPVLRRRAELDGRPLHRDGVEIPIEERDPAEVTARFAARNPAFDVTPAELITAIVTEHGVHRAPYADVARGGGGRRREGAPARRGLRDAAPAAHRHVAKELLPVGGRPIIDWIVDAIAARARQSTRSTSSRTRARRRVRELGGGRDVIVHDDGTTSNEDRLGAIGDIRFVDRSARRSTTICS